MLLPCSSTYTVWQHSSADSCTHFAEHGTYSDRGKLPSLPPAIIDIAITATATAIVAAQPGRHVVLVRGLQQRHQVIVPLRVAAREVERDTTANQRTIPQRVEAVSPAIGPVDADLSASQITSKARMQRLT